MEFQRGHAKVGGRRAGTPNRVPPGLREMTMEALTRVGGVDYFVWLARKHPLAFVRLLARLLPRPVEHVEQTRRVMVITGVPHGDPPTCTPEHTPAALPEPTSVRR